jgi:hypothetical protein
MPSYQFRFSISLTLTNTGQLLIRYLRNTFSHHQPRPPNLSFPNSIVSSPVLPVLLTPLDTIRLPLIPHRFCLVVNAIQTRSARLEILKHLQKPIPLPLSRPDRASLSQPHLAVTMRTSKVSGIIIKTVYITDSLAIQVPHRAPSVLAYRYRQDRYSLTLR